MEAFDIFALILVMALAWSLEWIMVNHIFNASHEKIEQKDLDGHPNAKLSREPGYSNKSTTLVQDDWVANRRTGSYS